MMFNNTGFYFFNDVEVLFQMRYFKILFYFKTVIQNKQFTLLVHNYPTQISQQIYTWYPQETKFGKINNEPNYMRVSYES